jgi:hypothetical protein
MPGYPQAARQAVTEMNRQVGPLRLGADGLARRGLLVRHLVMPGMQEETRAILRYVARELGTDTYVNLMAQYRPAGLVGSTHRDGYHEIARLLARDEYELAAEFADQLGLRRLDQRSRAAAVADVWSATRADGLLWRARLVCFSPCGGSQVAVNSGSAGACPGLMGAFAFGAFIDGKPGGEASGCSPRGGEPLRWQQLLSEGVGSGPLALCGRGWLVHPPGSD